MSAERSHQKEEEPEHPSAEMPVSAEHRLSLFFSPPLRPPGPTFRSLFPLALLPRSARILVLEDTPQSPVPFLLQMRLLKVGKSERLAQG